MIGGASYRGGRSHDLWAHTILAGASRGELINRGFIQPGNRSKWSGDEVEFVLDDEVRRIKESETAQVFFTRMEREREK